MSPRVFGKMSVSIERLGDFYLIKMITNDLMPRRRIV